MTELRVTAARNALTVATGDVDLCTYVYVSDVAQRESPRPYLHPLRTLAGDVVSLYRPHDHVWHKGISLALPNVGEGNFWGGPTYVRDQGYVQLPNNGSQVHDGFDAVDVTDGEARIEQRLRWITEQGGQWLTERRRLVFAVLPDADAWTLTFETALTNTRGAVIDFGSPTTEGRADAGYAGLFWRGPRSFNRGTILASQGPGGPEMMGERSRWLAYVGRHDEVDATSTLVFVDADSNPGHPTKWFVRDVPYACVCPAPFFDEIHPLAADDTLTLRYTVVVADGSWDAERIASVVKGR